MFVVITANKPDKRIFDVISALGGEGVRFVVTDEGSGMEYAPVFMRLREEFAETVTVIRNDTAIGRGHALRAAFEHISSVCGPGECILTLDSDLSKPVEAAVKVAAEWQARRESIVIGSFSYSGRIPFWKNVGVRLRRSVFAVTSGARIFDIESGLRAFSSELLPELIGIKGDRFDYEIAHLLHANQNRIEIYELPLEAPYRAPEIKRNFRDSWLIYRMILTFMLTSFSCSVIDYLTVLSCNALLPMLHSAVRVDSATVLIPMLGLNIDTKLIALITGRFIGSLCNFLLNRKVVFKASSMTSIFKYFLLVAALLGANYLIIALITTEDGIPLWLAQPIVQTALYPLNFILQRKWVFTEKKTDKEPAA